MSLKQIYEGWKNHLLPSAHLKDTINTVSHERMEICRGCPFNSINAKGYQSLRTDEHCTDCGCTLLPKTKCLSCFCPQHKWEAELTPEEENDIENEKNIQG